jgi:hypothetical protein
MTNRETAPTILPLAEFGSTIRCPRRASSIVRPCWARATGIHVNKNHTMWTKPVYGYNIVAARRIRSPPG